MATYKRLRYLLMTTDPVHVGTGGYRLGRVDNSIVREPGTRIPKIPGTSLHGAARHYAARIYETPEAAGQEHNKVMDPEKNPVCYTFGYIKKMKGGNGEGERTRAFSGIVNMFDAHILLFPVHSMAGPAWVTTKARLEAADIAINASAQDIPENGAVLTWGREEPLNLGWLMLHELKTGELAAVPGEWEKLERWRTVQDRIVVVHENLFSHIVNSNLEVRTSVAIDPKYGAAKDRALFTYEAIPRAAFLTAEAVIDDYRYGDGENNRPFPAGRARYGEGEPLPNAPWNGPEDVFCAGLSMLEWFGVGGMGTRGFGRIAVVGAPKIVDQWPAKEVMGDER